jgi:hypothetical protein
MGSGLGVAAGGRTVGEGVMGGVDVAGGLTVAVAAAVALGADAVSVAATAWASATSVARRSGVAVGAVMAPQPASITAMQNRRTIAFFMLPSNLFCAIDAEKGVEVPGSGLIGLSRWWFCNPQ